MILEHLRLPLHSRAEKKIFIIALFSFYLLRLLLYFEVYLGHIVFRFSLIFHVCQVDELSSQPLTLILLLTASVAIAADTSANFP